VAADPAVSATVLSPRHSPNQSNSGSYRSCRCTCRASRLCLLQRSVKTLTHAMEPCVLFRTSHHVAVLFVICQHGFQVGLAERWKVLPKMLNAKGRRNRAALGEVNNLICERFCLHVLHSTTDVATNQEPIMTRSLAFRCWMDSWTSAGLLLARGIRRLWALAASAIPAGARRLSDSRRDSSSC